MKRSLSVENERKTRALWTCRASCGGASAAEHSLCGDEFAAVRCASVRKGTRERPRKQSADRRRRQYGGSLSSRTHRCRAGWHAALRCRTLSEADINALLAELTRYARSHGYPAAAAYLPPQTNAEGALEIRILAGRYGKITIDSSAAIDDGQLRRLAHALHTGAPIEGRRLEKALYNIAALGGIEAAGLLSPGADFGTSDLTIRVRDGKRQSFVLYSENYGSKTSGRYRYGAQASLANLTRSGDRLSLAAMLSNEDLRNYSVTYTRPVGVGGTVLGLGVSRMDYELSGAFRRLGAQGHADTVSSLAHRRSCALRGTASVSPTDGTGENSRTSTRTLA